MHLAELPRLSETVVAPGRDLAVEVAGYVGDDGRSYIRVALSGAVSLKCQRCLEPVEHLVRHVALFQLWPVGAALPDEELLEDGFDALPAGNELDLVQLVEDEVLLGLPLSPRHTVCSLPEILVQASGPLPFDMLKNLKRSH